MRPFHRFTWSPNIFNLHIAFMLSVFINVICDYVLINNIISGQKPTNKEPIRIISTLGRVHCLGVLSVCVCAYGHVVCVCLVSQPSAPYFYVLPKFCQRISQRSAHLFLRNQCAQASHSNLRCAPICCTVISDTRLSGIGIQHCNHCSDSH